MLVVEVVTVRGVKGRGGRERESATARKLVFVTVLGGLYAQRIGVGDQIDSSLLLLLLGLVVGLLVLRPHDVEDAGFFYALLELASHVLAAW